MTTKCSMPFQTAILRWSWSKIVFSKCFRGQREESFECIWVLEAKLFPNACRSSVALNFAIFGKIVGYGHFVVWTKWFVAKTLNPLGFESRFANNKKDTFIFTGFNRFVSSLNKTDATLRPKIHYQNAVDYPSILVIAKSVSMNSMGNDKHLLVLQSVHQRFDKICGSNSVSNNGFFFVDFDPIFFSNPFELFESPTEPNQNSYGTFLCIFQTQIKSDASFSKFTRLHDQEPDYWIIRWTYDDKSVGGFAYQTSDHSIGMLFVDGFHFMRTPDKT